MVDFNGDISNPKGLPQLDKDYWQKPKTAEKSENLFDNLIQTNFDVEKLKGISVFSREFKD